MTRKLLVRQGGGTATEVDFLAIATPRKGSPWFDKDQPLFQVGQRFANGEAAMGYFKIVDPAAALSTTWFRTRPWAEVRLTEDASGDELTLGWMRVTANDASRRAPYTGGDQVEHDPQLMDCNMDLRGLPFQSGWHRDAENEGERLNALETVKLNGASSTGDIYRVTTDITVAAIADGHLADMGDGFDLPITNYPAGTEPAEVIEDVAGQAGKIWGVVLHHTGGSTHKCLLYVDQDDLTTYTTDVRISDQLADHDPEGDPPTFAPHWLMGAGREQNMEGVVSGLVSIYGGIDGNERTVFVETGDDDDDWETWVGVYNDDQSNVLAAATRRANTILADRRLPYQTHKVSILVNADQAHLVEAGMAIETKSVVMEPGPNKHAWIWRRVAEKTIEPVADGRYWLHLHLEKPRHTHAAGAGAGQPKSTNPKPAPEPVPGTGDSTEKFYNANDAGGDAENWVGLLGNQGGSADGAAGTDWYYYKSTSPNVYQTSWAASAGAVYRVEGYIGCRSATGGGLELIFTSSAAGTIGSSLFATTIEQHTLATNPIKHTHADEWAFFNAGPFTAPVGTTSAALGKVGSTVDFDEISVILVGTPGDSDVDAIDYGDFPHESTHWLPSDYVEARMDDLQTQVSALPEEIRNSLSWKEPVRAASTANGTLATAFENGDTLDGVTLATGDRILLKDQTTQADRGVYTVNASGAPTRAVDFDEDSEVGGAVILVMEGTANADQIYVCTTNEPIVIGTTSLAFAVLSGGSGGAPTTVDYLVGTADAGLSAEIVVGTTPGGELGGTWASPTVDATHSGSAHHAEDHNARHEDGGADELEVADLGTAESDTDLRLAPDGSGGVVWSTAPSSGAGSGNVLAEPQSGTVFVPSLALGDRVPASPGTYDQEFDGTADTLPSGWAWTSAPSGSDEWKLNSRWPSLLTVEGTGNTSYTLTFTTYSPAATHGLWIKMHGGPWIGSDQTEVRFYAFNSGSTEGRGMNIHGSGAGAAEVRALRTISSAESVWTGASALSRWITWAYMGITRDGSNQWEAWVSMDGIAWERIGALQSHTFTVDRMVVKFRTTTAHTFTALDWIRYRTDNNFPRP